MFLYIFISYIILYFYSFKTNYILKIFLITFFHFVSHFSFNSWYFKTFFFQLLLFRFLSTRFDPISILFLWISIIFPLVLLTFILFIIFPFPILNFFQFILWLCHLSFSSYYFLPILSFFLSLCLTSIFQNFFPSNFHYLNFLSISSCQISSISFPLNFHIYKFLLSYRYIISIIISYATTFPFLISKFSPNKILNNISILIQSLIIICLKLLKFFLNYKFQVVSIFCDLLSFHL